MGLIRCPECKKKISNKAISCPKCGFQPDQSAQISPKARGCGCIAIVLLVACIAVVIVALQPSGHQQASHGSTRSPSPNKQSTPETELPDHIQYVITNDDTTGTIKRSVDVRLTDRLSEEDLRLLAQHIDLPWFYVPL